MNNYGEEQRNKALNLLEKADEDAVWLMFRFLHDEQFIKGHILSVLNLMDEKKLKDFIEFFGKN